MAARLAVGRGVEGEELGNLLIDPYFRFLTIIIRKLSRVASGEIYRFLFSSIVLMNKSKMHM